MVKAKYTKIWFECLSTLPLIVAIYNKHYAWLFPLFINELAREIYNYTTFNFCIDIYGMNIPIWFFAEDNCGASIVQ